MPGLPPSRIASYRRDVPIGPEYMTEEIDGDGTEPYR